MTSTPRKGKAGDKYQDKASKSSFTEKQKIIEIELEHAARHGVNTARLGLVTRSYSDHLPIYVTFKDKKIMSWNMFADAYLDKQMMAVTGIKIIDDHCDKDNGYSRKIHHFLSELAHFLHKQSRKGQIEINDILLAQFVNAVPADRKNRDKIIADRQQLITMMTNPADTNHHEYKQAIEHACRLLEHLEGGLLWKNRYVALQQDKDLRGMVKNIDFINLQECTHPEDILKLANSNGKAKYQMITHQIDPKVVDNCVLIYNAERYELLDQIKFGLHHNTKPGIVAKFLDKETGETFIMGSVHHPGGKKEAEISTILEKMQQLQEPGKILGYCITGDYNNTKETIDAVIKDTSGVYFHSSKTGTMAGQDYGNTNKAIDGALSSEEGVIVATISQAVAVPLEQEVKIHFGLFSHKAPTVAEEKSPELPAATAKKAAG